jgi:hypothetical protein
MGEHSPEGEQLLESHRPVCGQIVSSGGEDNFAKLSAS